MMMLYSTESAPEDAAERLMRLPVATAAAAAAVINNSAIDVNGEAMQGLPFSISGLQELPGVQYMTSDLLKAGQSSVSQHSVACIA